jgi:hypothetical protein
MAVQCNLTVAMLQQMSKRQPGRGFVIDRDVSHARHMPVSGNCDRGKGRCLLDGCIDRDESLDAARYQHLRVRLQHFLIVAMNHGEEEVFRIAQILFNATDDGGSIRVANLLGDDADGKGALQAKGTCEVVRFVVEFPRRIQNAPLGVFRDSPGCRRIIQCR